MRSKYFAYKTCNRTTVYPHAVFFFLSVSPYLYTINRGEHKKQKKKMPLRKILLFLFRTGICIRHFFFKLFLQLIVDESFSKRKISVARISKTIIKTFRTFPGRQNEFSIGLNFIRPGAMSR